MKRPAGGRATVPGGLNTRPSRFASRWICLAVDYRERTMGHFRGCFCADTFPSSNALLHAAKLQGSDPEWSLLVCEQIERILLETGLSEHANHWTIDCRTTVCTVRFDTAIADYNEAEATDLLAEIGFGRAIWRRRYRENASYLILARSGCCFGMEPLRRSNIRELHVDV